MWLGIHREWLLQAVEVCAVVGGVIICTKVVKSKQEIKVVLPRQNYKKGLKLKKKKKSKSSYEHETLTRRHVDSFPTRYGIWQEIDDRGGGRVL